LTFSYPSVLIVETFLPMHAEVTIFTRVGIKRIATYAFQLAQARPRKLLTYVTKSNAMRNGMVLWDEVINEVAKDFPDVVSSPIKP
jgi:isocitrate/isopropylmalate dehydrogenase